MTLKRLFVSLGRRWYLTVTGVLITLGLCAGAYLNTEPTLERSASELLVPGKTTIPEGGNPYLYLGGLGQLSDVLASSLNSERTISGITDRFPGTTVAVARDTMTSGPVITVTVNGTKDAAVSGALAAMADQIPKTLESLQSSAAVPSDARISVLTVTRDDTSTVIQKSRFETVGLVAVAGLVLTVLLVGLVDGLLLGRRKRSAARAEADAASAPEASADDDAGTTAEPPAGTTDPARPARRPGRKRGRRPVPAAAPAPAASATHPTVDDVDEQDIDWEALLQQSAPGRESGER
ncbi:hypothetical protein DOE76_18105 [Leifsonia sp. ku-ls]|nr:hypothetical protein DOE76_18105 [Leifsonia sp. ku-ls]